MKLVFMFFFEEVFAQAIFPSSFDENFISAFDFSKDVYGSNEESMKHIFNCSHLGISRDPLIHKIFMEYRKLYN